MNRSACLIIILSLFLGACSTTRKGGYYSDDGPDSQPRDVSQVKEPVPRPEPLSKHGNKPYIVFGKSYRPLKNAKGYSRKGVASWYGKKFHGRRTSNGEKYNMYAMSAAHKTLPLPSYVRVRNLDNNRSVIVRVNDRGPFLHNRLIDLSYAAAYRLDIIRTGTGRVEVTAITSGQDYPVRARTESTGNTGGRIYLQVGAFSSQENANNLSSSLQAKLDQTVFVQEGRIENGTIYRVRIGPMADLETGQALADSLRKSHDLANTRLIIE
ncbi:MAG: septal ring lytic transglycosylase RlpA family protein, partial [Acidiferrobacterales bacterium]